MKKSSMIFFGFTHTKKSFSHELKFSSQSESIIVSPPPQHVPVEFLISQGTHTHSDTRTHTRRLWEKIPKQSFSANHTHAKKRGTYFTFREVFSFTSKSFCISICFLSKNVKKSKTKTLRRRRRHHRRRYPVL